MKSIFYHRPDSDYDDIMGEQYHFPKTYLSRVKNSLHDWIIFYGPQIHSEGRFYTGTAKINLVETDPNLEDHFYAYLGDYLEFDRNVEYKENGGYERKLINHDGSVNGGRAVQAVRNIEESEFIAIINAGLSQHDEWPDRFDHPDEEKLEQEYLQGLTDQVQASFSSKEFERPIIQQLSNRKWRDSKFRQHIRIAYNRTCAFTGLRLINGRGRPEIEAAHIRPVKDGGNDSIRNGIALSGTVHWMFDRGMLSLDNDLNILQSRQLNYDVTHLLNKDLKAKVPKQKNLQPHPEYLSWHRENVFKQ